MKIILTILLMLGEAAWAASSPRLIKTFDFDWRFHLGEMPDASAQNFPDADWRELDVPHDFSREGNFSETNDSCTAFLPGGIGWYRKTFVAPADWRDKLVSIQFGGVSMRSKVWINGHFLGERPYAYSTFNYDLTPWLNFSGTNVIAVRCDRSAIDDSRWYPGSGIYRHVWLMTTEKIHLAQNGIYITTPDAAAGKAQISIQTRVQNETGAVLTPNCSREFFSPNGNELLTLTNSAEISANGENNFTQNAEITVAATLVAGHAVTLHRRHFHSRRRTNRGPFANKIRDPFRAL